MKSEKQIQNRIDKLKTEKKEILEFIDDEINKSNTNLDYHHFKVSKLESKISELEWTLTE